MKYRFPFSPPNRADRTRLPALLVAVLAMAAIVQLLGARNDPLPVGLPAVQTARNFDLPVVRPITAAAIITGRPLFAPRQMSIATAAAVTAPAVLGGATVVGSISVRGRSYAVIRRADRSTVNLPVGGFEKGWRLVAIGSDSATFTKGEERRALDFGAAQATGEPEQAPSP